VAEVAVGLVTIKRGYRHGTQSEEWSNKYHLTGSDPADAAAWRALFDAFAVEEKKLFSGNTLIVRAYGYTSDSDTATAVWSVDMTVSPNSPVAGTLSTTSGTGCPSDAALWLRWKLDRNNSKGRPVYLRKYYHDVWKNTVTGPSTFDDPLASQSTALTAFGTLLSSGIGISSRKIRDTGGGNVIAVGTSPWITTRTLKRRGKRPPS
jgi:hypothetical protein